jgi:hypothetical protein
LELPNVSSNLGHITLQAIYPAFIFVGFFSVVATAAAAAAAARGAVNLKVCNFLLLLLLFPGSFAVVWGFCLLEKVEEARDIYI